MITITDKQYCSGCSACAQRCPKKSITMQQDEEGFLYPLVDTTICIECRLCEKVCPVLSSNLSHVPKKAFASINLDDDIRKESSSGGVFTMLSKSIIREGGVVFGARWDKDWNVEHSYEGTIDGLKAFRSSKYVQSRVNVCYQKTELFLKEGRRVLFSGTPCQIAGLKSYLCKDYDNLLTIECACHGVPSPRLWQKYLAEVSKGKEINSINHRDKRTGWRNYSVVMKFSDDTELSELHDDNLWMRAFIKNIDLRPSCYQCAFKIFNSRADLTLADLWGDRNLLPEQNEDKGITLVIVHSIKGEDAVCGIENAKDFILKDVVPFNAAIVVPPRVHPRRSEFMSRFQQGESFSRLVKIMTKDPFVLRISKMIK